MIEALFFLAAGLVIYAYLGYPAALLILDWIMGEPIRKSDIQPRVTLIIAAHNEERHISRKIENALSLEYPGDRLEIVVASDCSTDKTDEIVLTYRPRVKLCRFPFRSGKTFAQNKAAIYASGEILVFSDATTLYAPSAVKKLVRGFADPTVGCITGHLVYQNSLETTTGAGCVSYWSYETFLRNRESRLSSLVGVSGCMYAVRRSSFSDLDREMSSDFVIAAETRLRGLRAIYEPEAICFEETNARSKNEFRMRVRVVEQTISAISHYRRVIEGKELRLFWLQMLSHKAVRYFVPWALIILFLSSIALAPYGVFFTVALFAQAAIYGTGLLGLLADRAGIPINILSMPYYFLLANTAAAMGFVKFIRGESHVTWEPVRESEVGVDA